MQIYAHIHTCTLTQDKSSKCFNFILLHGGREKNARTIKVSQCDASNNQFSFHLYFLDKYIYFFFV